MNVPKGYIKKHYRIKIGESTVFLSSNRGMYNEGSDLGELRDKIEWCLVSNLSIK